MTEHRILLVDDDPFILQGIGKDLEYNEYKVTRAESGEAALTLLEANDFDLVITDLVMGKIDGIRVLKKAKEQNPDIQVIILTGFGDIKSAIEALRNQADDFLLKPCESQEMLFRVKNCLEKQEMTRKINLYQKILPMCCVCKKIRDDQGYWNHVETYISEHSKAEFSHSICPGCAKDLYPELDIYKE